MEKGEGSAPELDKSSLESFSTEELYIARQIIPLIATSLATEVFAEGQPSQDARLDNEELDHRVIALERILRAKLHAGEAESLKNMAAAIDKLILLRTQGEDSEPG